MLGLLNFNFRMNCIATRIPYRQTHAFSRIAMDYIDQAASIRHFFSHPPTLQGLQKAIDARNLFPQDREVLVRELKKQYDGIETSGKVRRNIESLLSSQTFTICTAHQNNIFTGPLYFIYKILHTIRLAEQLKETLPHHDFVPVFYIGTEDADLDELNHIYLGNEKLVWETRQTGAVGRMKIDKALRRLIDRMEGQLTVLPHGAELISLLKKTYSEGATIANATFSLVNALFSEFGLVVLQPDNAALKKLMIPVFEDELLHQTSSGIVEQATQRLENEGYKVQAHPREINLFYLENDTRERILPKGRGLAGGASATEGYKIQVAGSGWTQEEMIKELKEHPGKFSPNVILRGLYQETILPNIAFIGGAGETAYWLQLKDLFDHYKVPFPVLVLRNSFLVVQKKWQEAIVKLGFGTEDFFLTEQELMTRIVEKESRNATKLNGSLAEVEKLYDAFRQQAVKVDSTLEKHVEALRSRTLYRLQELEKKMLRAEKRKFADRQRQIRNIKSHLFPGDGLQERKENFSGFYAKWGMDFIRQLYNHSPGLEHEFTILTER